VIKNPFVEDGARVWWMRVRELVLYSAIYSFRT
jgi:hypothetical protein